MRDRPGSGDSTWALQVADLSHRFGARQALAEVSFAVPCGAFAVLLGRNGAGKTTLFNLITRLYDNRSGSIRILGIDVRQHPCAALARLGVVFQQRAIDLDLSVRHNLVYHAGLHGIPRREAKRRAERELSRLGLAGRAADKVRTLSSGQARRVEIARALLHRPRLLLLDEATAGLDIESRAGLLDRVRRLCAEEGVGVLWATHLIEEVGPEDQAVLLHEGRLLAIGDPPSICARVGAADLREAFVRLTDATPDGAQAA